MEVVYYNSYIPSAATVISSDTLKVNQADWQKYTKTVTCPKDCQSMTVEFYNNKKNTETSFYIDNVSMARSAQ